MCARARLHVCCGFLSEYREAEQNALALEMLRASQEAEARRIEAAKHAPPEPPAPPPKIEELVIRTVLPAGPRGLSRNPG